MAATVAHTAKHIIWLKYVLWLALITLWPLWNEHKSNHQDIAPPRNRRDEDIHNTLRGF